MHPRPHGSRGLLELGHCAEIAAIREKAEGTFSFRNIGSQKWHLALSITRACAELSDVVTRAPGMLGSVAFIPGGHEVTLGIPIRRRGEEVLGHPRHFEAAPRPYTQGNTCVFEAVV